MLYVLLAVLSNVEILGRISLILCAFEMILYYVLCLFWLSLVPSDYKVFLHNLESELFIYKI